MLFRITFLNDSSGGFIVLRTRRQPFFFGPLQRARSTGAGFAELGGLLWIALEQIRQRQGGVDLGNDAVDARDLGLGLRDLLLQRQAFFGLFNLGAQRLVATAAFVAAVTRIAAHAARRQHGGAV